MFFLLFATFTIYLAWEERADEDGLIWIALACVVILFFSVLAHELGHFFAAVRLGGFMDAIDLGPLGGLRPVRVPHDPQAELLAVLAGPLVSLAICLGCFCIVALRDQTAYGLLNPLAPQYVFDVVQIDASQWGTFFRLSCWINWWLVVVNLIPAFPFDGGRGCLALIQSVRPSIDKQQAVGIVAALARLVAIGLIVLAIVFHDRFPSGVPTWLPLVLLAIFVFFAARMEESQGKSIEPGEEEFGYDFSQGYTSLEGSTETRRRPPGLLERWLHRTRVRRQQRQAALEAAEDRRVDDILRRLHDEGIDSLSAEERYLLKRVSARYRSRTRE
jgi:Zn-dependent protease